jgi:anti-sigma factor RsiW
MNRPARECALVAPMLTAREGELSPEERALRESHLAGCDGCTALAADFAASEGMVSEALLAQAARRDFAPFVDAVMERVSVRPEREVERRTSWVDGVLSWARAHRAVAAASALAPTLAAAALIVYFSASVTPAPLAGDVEVVAEGRAAMVLQTSDGPVVLLDSDPDAT